MNLSRFRYYTDWHQYANQEEYMAPADPWKLLSVAPNDVTYYNGELRLNWGLGRVHGGNWDDEDRCRPIRGTTLYRGLKQRFIEGRDWEETALYQRAKRQFERGESVRGYASLTEFREVRCMYIDDLYRKIEREGYRPNVQASHEKASENRFEDAYANHLEPLVVVGRDGEIFWTEGNHRFTIASLLGVDEIPVYVLCRHEEWQRIRDRLADTPQTELPTELEAHIEHPDVQDVRPE